MKKYRLKGKNSSGESAAQGAPGEAACQFSTSLPPSEPQLPENFTPYHLGLADSDILTVEETSKGGRRFSWPLEGPDIAPPQDGLIEHGQRSDFQGLVSVWRDKEPRESWEMSTKARLRAAWGISNASVVFSHMLTLTYPESRIPKSYAEASKHRKALFRRIQKTWPDTALAWIIEFTKKKAPHFHVFIGGELTAILDAEPLTVHQGKKFNGITRDRTVTSGKATERIVKWWANQAGDGSEAFRAFQAGGILEVIQDRDASGKYVAKEAGKREQKIAPWPVSKWWGMTDNCRPRIVRTFEMTVGDFVALYGARVMRHRF